MRKLVAVVAACLLTPLFVRSVAAEQSLAKYPGVFVGAASSSGGPWAYNDVCQTGFAGAEESRCAFEFDISALGLSAKVTSAVLSITRDSGCPTNDCPVGIYSYTGDGSASPSDVTLGTSIATWTPTSNTTHQWNVQGQIQAHAAAGHHWAGFRLSSSTGNNAVQAFDFSPTATGLHLAVTYIANPINIAVATGSASNGGTGQVTSTPAGIDCGATCSAVFDYGQSISLTAEGTNGSTFAYWQSEVCTGQGATCTFDVPPVSIQITAFFTGIGPPITQPPPPPTPTFGTPQTPGPSSHATPTPSKGPVFTTQPGHTSAPGTSSAPVGSAEPGASIGPGSSGPDATPTLAPLETPHDSQNASGEGGVPIVLILLVAVLAIAVGGGAWYAARRGQGASPGG